MRTVPFRCGFFLLPLLLCGCSDERQPSGTPFAPLILKADELLPADYESVASLLDLTERTLAFVERERPLPEARSRLAELQVAAASAQPLPGLLDDLRQLRCEIIF